MTGAWLPDERITPDEATELFRFAGCDLLQRAMDLYEAYRRERGVSTRGGRFSRTYARAAAGEEQRSARGCRDGAEKRERACAPAEQYEDALDELISGLSLLRGLNVRERGGRREE